MHMLAVASGRSRRFWGRKGPGRHVRALGAAAALLVTAAGTGIGAGALGAPGAGASPAHSASAKAVSGGVPSYALAVGEIFTWILPLENENAYEDWDSNIEGDMWLPLYWAGKGSHTGINYTQSIGKKPVFSDHNKTVTINLKTNFKWSTGAAVTSNDVKFYFQLLSAGKKKLGNYLPGLMPDNIASITYPSPTSFVMHLKKAYNPVWFTGNQLTWIYPLPVQAWDRTSATSPAGSAASTPAGAKQVFTFLFSQSKDRQTYPTNPLWKTVDGPFQISGYDAVTHTASFVTNSHYTGPTKPRIAGYKVYSFTTGTAELDALESGSLDVGYVPFTSLKVIPRLESQGYKIAYWTQAAFGGLILNYAKKDAAAPILSQLYVRQALTHLIDMKAIIDKIFHGHASYASSPIPNPNGQGANVTALGKRDPYPYNVSAAKKLLAKHGWHVVPNGTSTCEKPGKGPGKCGKGIAKGAKLVFRIVGTQSSGTQYALLQYIDSQFSDIGASMKVKLVPQSNLPSDAAQCSGKVSKCSWDMELWMGEWPLGWTPYVETGGNTFFCGATSNYLAYCTPKLDAMITANHKSANPISALKKWENYMAKQQLQIYLPMPAYRVVAYKKGLKGVTPLTPYLQIQPTRWHYSK